jgi:hypothetical protein
MDSNRRSLARKYDTFRDHSDEPGFTAEDTDDPTHRPFRLGRQLAQLRRFDPPFRDFRWASH